MPKRVLKTHDVIKIKETELVDRLKTMSLEELEFHALNIMKDMGADNYPSIMTTIIKTIKEDDQEGFSRFETVQKTLQDILPNKAYMSDIYARLAAMVMTIISRKYADLL